MEIHLAGPVRVGAVGRSEKFTILRTVRRRKTGDEGRERRERGEIEMNSVQTRSSPHL